jgi:large repetitive protein
MSGRVRFSILASAIALLAACDADLLSPRLASTTAAARASAGSSLYVYPQTGTQIAMNWNDNVRNENGWEIHRAPGVAGPFALVVTLPANTQFYSDAGLSMLTEYCYQVRSVRQQGPNTTYGALSNVSCATTYGPPGAPVAVAMPEGSTQVKISWNAVPTALLYRIQRADAPVGPWTDVVTGYSGSYSLITASAAEVTACFRVLAWNAYGEGPPSDASCTVPPNTPTNLLAVGTTTASIDLSWTDNSAVEDGYELLRARDGESGWTKVITLPANRTSYSDTDVIPDVPYRYAARATRDGGHSNYSNVAYAAAITAPPPAVTIDAWPSGSVTGVIQWWNVSFTAASVRVERSPDGVSGWSTVGTAPAATAWFNDIGLTPETSTCYRAFAVNAAGESPASNVDCFIALAAPTSLQLTGNADGSVLATWTDNSSHETYYALSVFGCDPWGSGECGIEYMVWLPADVTEYVTAPGDVVNAVYACNSDGCSSPAQPAGGGMSSIAATSAARTAALAAPTTLDDRVQLRERLLHARPMPRAQKPR